MYEPSKQSSQITDMCRVSRSELNSCFIKYTREYTTMISYLQGKQKVVVRFNLLKIKRL